jgi:hypothetical protein
MRAEDSTVLGPHLAIYTGDSNYPMYPDESGHIMMARKVYDSYWD